MNHLFTYFKNAARLLTKPEVPPDLIFFVTSRCNAKCGYCHFKASIDDKQRKKDELSLDEIKAIASNYGPISKLSLCGGEPFLRRDIPEIIQAFVDSCDVRIIDIPTNGFYTNQILEQTRRILEKNDDLVCEIQLSIDGREKVHDEIREVKGLYKKSIETTEQLLKLRELFPQLRVKMNLTYQEGNENEVEEFTREFESKYLFDRFQITFPHGGDELREKINNLSYDKFHKLSRKIQLNMKMGRSRDLHSLIFRAIKVVRDDVLLSMLKKKSMGNSCGAGSRILVIDDIGNVFPCEPLWKSVGNLRNFNYEIRNILHSPEMFEFGKEYLSENKCNCTWGCIALDKIVFNPIYYPKVLYYIMYLKFIGGHGYRKIK